MAKGCQSRLLAAIPSDTPDSVSMDTFEGDAVTRAEEGTSVIWQRPFQ